MTLRYRGWQDQAACRDMDPLIFFPSRRGAGRAIAICKVCPVRFPCLHAALEEECTTHRDELAGVRGGLTAAARYRLRVLFYGRAVDNFRPENPEQEPASPDDRPVIEEVSA